MKKTVMIVFLLVLFIISTGCSVSDPVISSLPDYNSRVFYTSGGFQDYTDYAKYTYKSISAQDFEASEYFCEVSADDIEEILIYIDNYEEWVETIGSELKNNYDFDKSVISEGDFFYTQTSSDNSADNKFADYTIYYFDADSKILYYFHNNI